MKLLSFIVLAASFNVFADETCFSSLYDFRITNSYIEATGQGEYIRIPYTNVRTLSRRSRTDFKAMIKNLSDDINTDVVLSQTEAELLERFTLTAADGREDIIGMLYAKGYDKSGFLIVRYMVTEDGAYRCK
jgi:hypothetical protein